MKKLTKFLFVSVVVIFLASFFSLICNAEENLVNADNFGGIEIYDSVPEDVKELFKKLGIDSVDFDSMFNVGVKDIAELFKNLITGAVESPLNSAVRLIAVIIIVAVFECFVPEDVKILSIMELIGNLLCIVTVIKPITTAITSAVASITVTENFMLVLIPVLTAVVSVSGNPALASSFQSIAFGAAQVISALATKVIIPIVGAVLALDISGSLVPRFKLSALTGMVKKTVTYVLSLSSTLFVSFLSLKAGLANSVDTMLGKGVKIIISSAVPVVGGALSEAYSGVVGSLVLVKSTIGVFGISAVALATLPSVIQLLFWVLALKVASGVAELFEQNGVAALLKSLSSSLVLLNVVLIFVAVLFIISTALILIIKAR